MKRLKRNLPSLNTVKIIAIMISFCMISQPLFAQKEGLEAPATDDSEQSTGSNENFRTKKYINLTMGFEETIKLPKLPPNVVFKGTFRSIVTAERNVENNLLKLTPKQSGFATLTIHDKSKDRVIAEYRIDVKVSKLDKVIREVRSLLIDIEGITIKVANDKVLIDGQVLLPKDLGRVFNVVALYPDQVVHTVTISPIAQKKIAEFISRDINNPEITVRTIDNKIILEGFANSEEEMKKAEIIAKLYLPPVYVDPKVQELGLKVQKPVNDGVINLIVVKETPAAPPAKMVQLVVHYVELKKDYSKAFRFQFTPTLEDKSQMQITSGGSAGGVVTQLTGIVSGLLPKLNSAKQHGHARVLETTSLIVEDGKKGEISQVTQQPYSVIGRDGVQGTAFTDVGIQAGITPVILGEKSGSVAMDMSFSISAMLGTAQNGAPITSKNTINSRVTVRDRQSAAVGGLIKNSTSTGYNRNPASANPIINLYASKEFQRDQSQFVVFVTPIIKTSASSGSEQTKRRFHLKE